MGFPNSVKDEKSASYTHQTVKRLIYTDEEQKAILGKSFFCFVSCLIS